MGVKGAEILIIRMFSQLGFIRFPLLLPAFQAVNHNANKIQTFPVSQFDSIGIFPLSEGFSCSHVSAEKLGGVYHSSNRGKFSVCLLVCVLAVLQRLTF